MESGAQVQTKFVAALDGGGGEYIPRELGGSGQNKQGFSIKALSRRSVFNNGRGKYSN